MFFSIRHGVNGRIYVHSARRGFQYRLWNNCENVKYNNVLTPVVVDNQEIAPFQIYSHCFTCQIGNTERKHQIPYICFYSLILAHMNVCIKHTNSCYKVLHSSISDPVSLHGSLDIKLRLKPLDQNEFDIPGLEWLLLKFHNTATSSQMFTRLISHPLDSTVWQHHINSRMVHHSVRS